MSDHQHYGEYADPYHNHSDYAEQSHDHDLYYAEKNHWHHDLERKIEKLESELAHLRATVSELDTNLDEAIDRIEELESDQWNNEIRRGITGGA